jgi:hypothetical protein
MLIYALIDPRDGQTRYIGKTVRTPHRRLRRHLALETCNSEIALNAAEIRQIAEHRACGVRLTNATDGGEGATGWKGTAESRARLSAALKGKPKSPAHRAKVIAMVIGRKASAETKAKLSAARKGKNTTPRTEAYRITMRDAKGGRPFVDQHGTRYETQKGAARDLCLNPAHVNAVLNGTRKSTGGYVFTYLRVQEFPL